jgi:hypothetical protein
MAAANGEVCSIQGQHCQQEQEPGHEHSQQQQSQPQKSQQEPAQEQHLASLLETVAAAGSCQPQQQQQQQQQQQLGMELTGNDEDLREQVPAAALLSTAAGSCNWQQQQLQVKDSAVHNSGSDSSSYPQAVFNKVTGRAGVHQPLQLDSWRDWDAMAGSMDEEGGSGFGAWAAGHDD